MFKRRNYSRYQNKSKRSAYAKGKYPMQKGRVASRYSLINTVQQVLTRNSELKYYDTAFSQAFNATASSVTNITAVPQGTTDTNRIGDRLRIRSVELRWTCLDAATTISANSKQIIRMVLVQWFPATAPAFSDILTTTSSRAFYSHDNRQMFKVCWDKTVSIIGGTQAENKSGHVMYYPKKNQNVQFQNAGTVGTNRFYFIILGDNVGAGVTSDCVVLSRVRFTDS